MQKGHQGSTPSPCQAMLGVRESQWGGILHTNLSDPLLVPRSALRWPTPQLGVSLSYPYHLWTPLHWGVSPRPLAELETTPRGPCTSLLCPEPRLQLHALCTLIFLLDPHQFISTPYKVWCWETELAETRSPSPSLLPCPALPPVHDFIPFPTGLSERSQLSHLQTGHEPCRARQPRWR